jgi:tetratricopeptide (TPR) repeat protein
MKATQGARRLNLGPGKPSVAQKHGHRMNLNPLRGLLNGPARKLVFAFADWSPHVERHPFLKLERFVSARAPTLILSGTLSADLRNFRHLISDHNLILLGKTKSNRFNRNAVSIASAIPKSIFVARSMAELEELDKVASKKLRSCLLLRHPLYLKRGDGVEGFVFASATQKNLESLNGAFSTALPGTVSSNKEDLARVPPSFRHVVVGTVLSGENSDLLNGDVSQGGAKTKANVDAKLVASACHRVGGAGIAYLRNPMSMEDSTFVVPDSVVSLSFGEFLRHRNQIQTLFGSDSTVLELGRLFGIEAVRLDIGSHRRFDGQLHFAATSLIRSSDRRQVKDNKTTVGGHAARDAVAVYAKLAYPDDRALGILCASYVSEINDGRNGNELRLKLVEKVVSLIPEKSSSLSAINRFCSVLGNDSVKANDFDSLVLLITGGLPENWFPRISALNCFRLIAQNYGAGLEPKHYEKIIKSNISAVERLSLAAVLSGAERNFGAVALSRDINWSALPPSKQMVSVAKSHFLTTRQSAKLSKACISVLDQLTVSGFWWQEVWELHPEAVVAALDKHGRMDEDAVKLAELICDLEKRRRKPSNRKLDLILKMAKYAKFNPAFYYRALDIAISKSKIGSLLALLRTKYREDPKVFSRYLVRRLFALLLMKNRRKIAKKVLRWGHDNGISECGQMYNAILIAERNIDADIDNFMLSKSTASSSETIRIVDALQAIGRRDEAFKILRGAVNDGLVHKKDAILPFTRMLQSLGNYSAAIIWFESIDPQQLTAAMAEEFSNALVAAGRPNEALDLLEFALERHPGRVSLMLHAGKVMSKSGRFLRAASMYQQVLAKSPMHPVALKAWGDCAVLSGIALDQIDALRQRSKPVEAEAFLMCHLASLLLASGRLADAADEAFRAAKKQPGNVQIAEFAGGILSQIDDKVRLREVNGWQMDAQVLSAYNRRRHAQRHLHENDHEMARTAAADAVRLEPSDSFSHFVQGRVQFGMGNLEEAAESFTKALQCNPAYFHASAQLARIRLQQHQTSLANETIDIALCVSQLQFQPPDTQALAIKAEIADHDGQLETARQHYQSVNDVLARTSEPPNMRIAWSAGLVAAALGDISGQADNVALLGKAIHQTLPHSIPVWRGQPLGGRKIALSMRGGPGDELRTTHSVLSHLLDLKCDVTLIGDGRLERVFKRNFPEMKFVANPKSGRRLANTGKPIARKLCNSLSPLTYEAWSRFGLYLPASVMKECDYLMFSDDLWQTAYFDQASQRSESAYQRTVSVETSKARSVSEYLDNLGPAFRVAISWRGAYFSANRPQTAAMSVEELGLLLSLEGVDFIDLHPNKFSEEYKLIRKKFPKARIHRPEQFDLMNDFETLGLIFKKVNASILPGITQRDVAAAFGADNILSFGLKAGAHESWRINPVTKQDRLQSNIAHFTLNDLGSREAVVQALANEIARLRDQSLQ